MLSALRDGGSVYENIEDAPHGALIMTRGTVVFVDKSISELAVLSFGLMIDQEKAKPKHLQDKAQIQSVATIKDFLAGISFPSSFLLQNNDGAQIVGIVKDEGMEEPISSYYFKHGAAGLADVYAVGIKEIPSAAIQLPDTGVVA